MGFLKNLFKKPKTELQICNQNCNELFQSVFVQCRFDYGRELIHLMELKKDILDRKLTPLQELLAKQMIEITSAYFNMALSMSEMNKSGSEDEAVEVYKKETTDKMKRVLELATSLHQHILMKTAHSNASDGKDQFYIDEAEALCTVLDKAKIIKGQYVER